MFKFPFSASIPMIYFQSSSSILSFIVYQSFLRAYSQSQTIGFINLRFLQKPIRCRGSNVYSEDISFYKTFAKFFHYFTWGILLLLYIQISLIHYWGSKEDILVAISLLRAIVSYLLSSSQAQSKKSKMLKLESQPGFSKSFMTLQQIFMQVGWWREKLRLSRGASPQSRARVLTSHLVTSKLLMTLLNCISCSQGLAVSLRMCMTFTISFISDSLTLPSLAVKNVSASPIFRYLSDLRISNLIYLWLVVWLLQLGTSFSLANMNKDLLVSRGSTLLKMGIILDIIGEYETILDDNNLNQNINLFVDSAHNITISLFNHSQKPIYYNLFIELVNYKYMPKLGTINNFYLMDNPILSFSQIKPGQKQLDEFKEQYKKLHKIEDEYYFSHPDVRILMCYLYFAFTNKKTQLTQAQKIFQKRKIFKKEKSELWNKFSLNASQIKNRSLVELVRQKQNTVTMNKMLLQNFCDKLQYDDCHQLLISGLNSSKFSFNATLITNQKEQKIVAKPKANDNIIILQADGVYYAIFYSTIKKLAIGSEIMESDNKEQKNNKGENSNIKRTDSDIIDPKEEQTQIKRPKSPGYKQIRSSSEEQPLIGSTEKVKKSKSEGANIQPQKPRPLEDNDITWFQVAVFLIILLTILSEAFDIFDSFLHEYNTKVGHYYLIETGYNLGKSLFQAVAHKVTDL